MKLFISLSEEKKRPELPKVNPGLKIDKPVKIKPRQIPVVKTKGPKITVEDDDRIVDVKLWAERNCVQIKRSTTRVDPAKLDTGGNYSVYSGSIKLGGLYFRDGYWHFIHLGDGKPIQGLDKDPETRNIRL